MKNLRDYLINEAANDFISYLKQEFGDVEIEERIGNEYPSPITFKDDDDWTEIFLNGFDYEFPISIAYSKDLNKFIIAIDSLTVIMKGNKIEFGEDDPEGIMDATEKNWKKINKAFIKKVIKTYDNV